LPNGQILGLLLRKICKFFTFKSSGSIYEKEIAKGAHRKPPKRKINLFGGSLDIYTADYSGKFSIVVLQWAIFLVNLK
jgi:hypothetical protein